MSRNFRRQSRKDSRRAIRWAGIARKRAGLLVAVLAAGIAIHAAPSAKAEPAGADSALFVLFAWDHERQRERVAATHLQPGDCFIAAGAIINSGGDAGCMPMGRVASLEE